MKHRHGVPIANPKPRHCDVRATRTGHRNTIDRRLERANLVRPGSGRIHDNLRPNRQVVAGDVIANSHTTHSTTDHFESCGRCVIQNRSPRFDGRNHVGQRQAGIVARRVVIARASQQFLRPQLRLGVEHLCPRETVVARGVPEHRQRIVQSEAHRQLDPRHARAAVDWPGERQRSYEMGRDAHERTPFATRFEHQVQVPMFEVPDAAMDEPRRSARRSAREVSRLDERDAETAQGGVARDARAGDAAANDGNVKGLDPHTAPDMFAPRKSEGVRLHCTRFAVRCLFQGAAMESDPVGATTLAP
jgi:hypothetical protein